MIETNNLTKIFKINKGEDIPAVVGLTLNVHEGEVFGFLGPNGAGKTTTIRMLTTLIGPTSGSARVCGFDLGTGGQEIRHSVGILTESPGMYENLSAGKNLTIYAKLYDVEDVEGQVRKYLQMLGLWSRRDDPVGSFSKGMRQKLAICRAILHEPRLLFLDEPTSGLDPEAAKLVRLFIEELRGQGRTIFICTHNLNEADRLCDRIGFFRTRLIDVDTPENLRLKLFGRKVVIHLRSVDPAWPPQLMAIDDVNDVSVVDNKLLVSLDDPERNNPHIIRSLVSAGADIQFVGELRHTLEDIYLQMMRDNQDEETGS